MVFLVVQPDELLGLRYVDLGGRCGVRVLGK
jgi:hypothetical protein